MRRLRFFEVESPELLQDKRSRLSRAGIPEPENVRAQGADIREPGWAEPLWRADGFDRQKRTLCALPGLAAKWTRAEFWKLFLRVGELLAPGGAVVFDYPGGAGGYSPREVETTLSLCGFRAYEHLTPSEITRQFFGAYNAFHPEAPMTAPGTVHFCMAVKKGPEAPDFRTF